MFLFELSNLAWKQQKALREEEPFSFMAIQCCHFFQVWMKNWKIKRRYKGSRGVIIRTESKPLPYPIQWRVTLVRNVHLNVFFTPSDQKPDFPLLPRLIKESLKTFVNSVIIIIPVEFMPGTLIGWLWFKLFVCNSSLVALAPTHRIEWESSSIFPGLYAASVLIKRMAYARSTM